MANDTHAQRARVRWARLRFQILGTLMAAPADDGQLKARIEALAARAWRHPTTGESIRFSFKTIERWWYIARGAQDPFAALARKVHAHAGTHPSVSPALAEAIARQHRDHPRWTWQLHHDNLVALAREDPSLGLVPGYATVCRFMRGQGLVRARNRRHGGRAADTTDRQVRPPPDSATRERRAFVDADSLPLHPGLARNGATLVVRRPLTTSGHA
jgi:hypothetical protein